MLSYWIANNGEGVGGTGGVGGVGGVGGDGGGSGGGETGLGETEIGEIIQPLRWLPAGQAQHF